MVIYFAFLFFLAVDDIDKRTVFQVDLVLLDVLADGVARLLVGILNSLHSHWVRLLPLPPVFMFMLLLNVPLATSLAVSLNELDGTYSPSSPSVS